MTEGINPALDLTEKTCTKCRETKPISEFFWQKTLERHRPDCKACVSAKQAAYYAANREAVRAKHAAYRDENRDRVRLMNREYNRVHRASRAPSVTARTMTADEYAAWLEAQGNRCYLCGDDLSEVARIAVDHDHRCCRRGRSCAICRRGIACLNCNSLIGMAYDDPERLRRAADALEFAQAEVDFRAYEAAKSLDTAPRAPVSVDGLVGQLALFAVVRGKIREYSQGYGHRTYTAEERKAAEHAAQWRYRERKRDELRAEGLYQPPREERSECPAGHPYDEANTYWHEGSRKCRACARERAREYDRANADRVKAYRQTQEYRDRANARRREQRLADPEYRERSNARRREQYRENPGPRLESRRRYVARKRQEKLEGGVSLSVT